MNKILLTIILMMGITLSIQARTTCSQFKDHKQAQRFFEKKGHGYKSLDRDKDGEACECLRGGSSYNKSICKRWRKKYGK